MTLQEACIRLGKSERTLREQFPRTKENLAKKGIVLTRQGRGQNAEYFIEYLSEVGAIPTDIKGDNVEV